MPAGVYLPQAMGYYSSAVASSFIPMECNPQGWEPPGLGTPQGWDPPRLGSPRAGNPQGWEGAPSGPRGGARVDFTRFFDDFGVPKWGRKIPRGPKGPPQRTPKFEDGAKVTAAGAEGDRQKYMTVVIFRLSGFRALPGTILVPPGSPRGSLWAPRGP